MAQKWISFKLLMWKNFTIDRRRPIRNFLTIATPIIFGVLICVVRHLSPYQNGSPVIFKEFTPYLSNNYGTNITNIGWSPCKNNALKLIMKKVADKLKLNATCFQNEKQMLDVISNATDTYLAGVQFDDALSDRNSIPQSVDIKLRFPPYLRADGRVMSLETWKTSSLFPDTVEQLGPREPMYSVPAPDYNHQQFLFLQREVSYGIIEHFQPEFDRNQTNIKLQRLPYPKWTDDRIYIILIKLMGLIMAVTFMSVFTNIIKGIVVEKETQMKETLMIMGLPRWLIWMSWFVTAFIYTTISAVVIVILYKVYDVLPRSNPLIILLLLLIYLTSSISLSFTISTFFSKSTKASTFANVLLMITCVPFLFFSSLNTPMFMRIFVGLFPNSIIMYSFRIIVNWEDYIGTGLQWNNLWEAPTPFSNDTIGFGMIMLVVDSVLYLLLAVYIDQIIPGEYGIAKKWHFPLTMFFNGKEKSSYNTSNIKQMDETSFEQEPINLKAGIKIKNLRKSFGDSVAVNDLTLNMYENQITALLGHNGAGKTTTIMMLIGMYSPSGGTATLGGQDIHNKMDEIRNSLGICPQHNVLFDDLTVKEHMYFFCKLKGVSDNRIEQEITRYLTAVELSDKANALSKNLSGGMKRKLSVATALCGDSKIIICDEPSSGMDPSARRSLWDFLQSQKHGRTILLTTHFMDEADVLGDRIAIMAEGQLQCCGSSYFLKKKFGTGYHLVVDKLPSCDVDKVTYLLQKHIPVIEMEKNVGSEIMYILSADYAHVFEKMLGELEVRGGSLGVRNYGISLTTMEEVFMKVGADANSQEMSNNFHSNILSSAYSRDNETINFAKGSNFNSPKACNSWCNQILAMLLKRGISWMRLWYILLIMFLGPTFLAYSLGDVDKFRKFSPELKIDLSKYKSPITLIGGDHVTLRQYYIYMLGNQKQVYHDVDATNFSQYIIKRGDESFTTYNYKYIVGAFFKEQNVTAYFNGEAYHSSPLALGLVMNALFKSQTGPAYSINIFNAPLKYTNTLNFLEEAIDIVGQLLNMIEMIHLATIIAILHIPFYVKERVCGFKHMQFVSGVHPVIYWSVPYVCDILTYSLACLIMLISSGLVRNEVLNIPTSVQFVVLFSYGISLFPLLYLLSFMFKVPSAASNGLIVGCLIAVSLSQIAAVFISFTGQNNIWSHLFPILPCYNCAKALIDIFNFYMQEQALKDIIKQSVYSWSTPGVGSLLATLWFEGFVYFFLLILVEYRLIQRIIYQIRQYSAKPPPNTPLDIEPDEDVLEEARLVRNMSEQEINRHNVTMRNVSKYFGKFVAVDQLCLAVKEHECFGLLGVNGAGKTTTFRMLTGEETISYGDAWIQKWNVKNQMKNAYKVMGYCPQFDALLDDFTGEETMRIICLLRGINYKNSNKVIVDLAQQFDFYGGLKKATKNLSGGNKRKLSTAIAIIGNPPILYLDEPTTGMDPASKRHVWNVLTQLREDGKCIILTSHSMEECEALCTRLTIMVRGKFLCLGSRQRLKSKYSTGYSLTIKTTTLEDVDVKRLENYIMQNFPSAILREKHEKLLTFYIPDASLPYSVMFGIMERGKGSYAIEDYSIAQCNLEQVFLSFTKYHE